MRKQCEILSDHQIENTIVLETHSNLALSFSNKEVGAWRGGWLVASPNKFYIVPLDVHMFFYPHSLEEKDHPISARAKRLRNRVLHFHHLCIGLQTAMEFWVECNLMTRAIQ